MDGAKFQSTEAASNTTFQKYPGLIDTIFQPGPVNAPYFFESFKAGYCQLAHFWLASLPDEDCFYTAVKKPHSQKSFTGIIYSHKAQILETQQPKKTKASPSETKEATPRPSLGFSLYPSPLVSKLMFARQYNFSSPHDFLHFLLSQKGRYIVNIPCLTDHEGAPFKNHRHCFALYSNLKKAAENSIIKIFDWRFGSFEFTAKDTPQIIATLNQLYAYYIGDSYESQFDARVNQAVITQEHQRQFIQEISRDEASPV